MIYWREYKIDQRKWYNRDQYYMDIILAWDYIGAAINKGLPVCSYQNYINRLEFNDIVDVLEFY